METLPLSADVQPRDDPQQCGLATTRGAEQSGQLPGRQGDVDVVERDEVTEALGDAGYLDAHLLDSLGRRMETTTMQSTLTNASTNDDGVRRRLLEALVLLLDEEGRGLGLVDDVARDDLDGAELTEAAGQAEHHAVDDGPLDARQGDPPERLAGVGPEAARGLLLLVADLLEHRHDLADHQRQRDEAGGHDHAGCR